MKKTILFLLFSLILSIKAFAGTATYTIDGSWDVPAGVTLITVQLWAPGGGGGSNWPDNNSGGGGGGGAYASISIPVTPEETYTFLIPAGGAGGVVGDGAPGGGFTTFTNPALEDIAYASPATGGYRDGQPGLRGLAVASLGDITLDGVDGTAGGESGPGGTGGAPGNAAEAGGYGYGGNGGAYDDVTEIPGTAGTGGMIKITWEDSTTSTPRRRAQVYIQ